MIDWSFALADYRALGLMGYLNEPIFQQLADIEDPYVYRDRLTMPKYMICACGDEVPGPSCLQERVGVPGEEGLMRGM